MAEIKPGPGWVVGLFIALAAMVPVVLVAYTDVFFVTPENKAACILEHNTSRECPAVGTLKWPWEEW